jgi:hypothetical protein
MKEGGDGSTDFDVITIYLLSMHVASLTKFKPIMIKGLFRIPAL